MIDEAGARDNLHLPDLEQTKLWSNALHTPLCERWISDHRLDFDWSLYRTKAEMGDDGDEQNVDIDLRPPSAEWLESTWAALKVDAVTVRLASADVATVALPVASELAGAYCSGETSHFANVVWLCRHLGELASSRYFDSESARRWTANNYTLQYKMTTHKQTAYDVSGGMVAEKSCSSNRPAYVIEAVRCEGNDTFTAVEILHLYCAMGLEGQHSMQSVILGRIADHAAAIALIGAASSVMDGLVIRQHLVTHCIPDGAHKRGTPTEIRQKFLDALHDAQIPVVEEEMRASDSWAMLDGQRVTFEKVLDYAESFQATQNAVARLRVAYGAG